MNLARELTLFFDRVYVPHAADTYNVRYLQADLDEGEAEALVQAQEREAPFFIGDERRAREIAGRMGRTPVGTLRLLARLNLEVVRRSYPASYWCCAGISIFGSPMKSYYVRQSLRRSQLNRDGSTLATSTSHWSKKIHHAAGATNS